MTGDLYTKAILTVIAVLLGVLAWQGSDDESFVRVLGACGDRYLPCHVKVQ